MPDQRIPHFGAAIAQLRQKAGLSQYELAKRLNKSQALISYWESGKETAPKISAEIFSRIAYLFDLEPHDLMQLAEDLADKEVGKA
jgi:transcriptional regulator with XRE-family HTH domain